MLYIMTGGSYHKVIISTITVFFSSHRYPTNHIFLRKMFFFHESSPSSHPWHILCDQNQMVLEIGRIPQNERKFMLRNITPINSKYSHQIERIMSINIFSSQIQHNLKYMPLTGNFSHTYLIVVKIFLDNSLYIWNCHHHHTDRDFSHGHTKGSQSPNLRALTVHKWHKY